VLQLITAGAYTMSAIGCHVVGWKLDSVMYCIETTGI
jgi:hypothetical protein